MYQSQSALQIFTNLIITMTLGSGYHKYSLLSNLFCVWVAKLDNKGYHTNGINLVPDFQTASSGSLDRKGFIQIYSVPKFK